MFSNWFRYLGNACRLKTGLPNLVLLMNDYIDQLTSLGMNKRNGHVSPHKAVMMLAVIDLVAGGEVADNRIVYSPELLEQFRKYFDIVRTDADAFSPLLPFFYLRSEPFWHHRAVPSKEAVCEALSDPGGARKLSEIVDSAFLDDELFAVLQEEGERQKFREVLISRYFGDHYDDLMKLAAQEEGVGLYVKAMREGRETAGRVKGDVRSLAFARVVKQAYHYQCAACGLRIFFEGASLVDAAHIVPFSVSYDDDPRNGLTLCKNHHWAMDQELIFPCSDNKWHVHKGIDDRIDTGRSLIDLDGKDILSPADKRFVPKESALQWREERMSFA